MFCTLNVSGVSITHKVSDHRYDPSAHMTVPKTVLWLEMRILLSFLTEDVNT